MNVKIRKMNESDIDFVIRANKEVSDSSNQNEIVEFESRLKTDVLSNNPKAYVIIAEIDDKPIGMALYSSVYYANEGQIMWLSNIFVIEEYRNKAVAKTMIKHLKQICCEQNYYAISCMVDEENNQSIQFLNTVNAKWLNNYKFVVIGKEG